MSARPANPMSIACGQFIPDRDKIILCLNQKVRELNPSCRGVILFTRSSKSARATAVASVAIPDRTGKSAHLPEQKNCDAKRFLSARAQRL